MDLCAVRLVVCSARFPRAAKDGIGNKDFIAREPDRVDQLMEISAGDVAVERDARPVPSITARSFGDEHYERIERTIEMGEHCFSLMHPFAKTAASGFFRQMIECLLFIHQLMRLQRHANLKQG